MYLNTIISLVLAKIKLSTIRNCVFGGDKAHLSQTRDQLTHDILPTENESIHDTAHLALIHT